MHDATCCAGGWDVLREEVCLETDALGKERAEDFDCNATDIWLTAVM